MPLLSNLTTSCGSSVASFPSPHPVKQPLDKKVSPAGNAVLGLLLCSEDFR